jgi:hypothetical protein
MSLTEFNEELEMVNKVYSAEVLSLNKLRDDSQTLALSVMPIEFSSDHEYEDHMIQLAHLKHGAIKLANAAVKLHGSAKSDLAHYSARLKLDHAEEGLRDRGFDRVTEALRDSFCDVHGGLARLSKMAAELDGLAKTTLHLIKAFESDEQNIKKLMELKNTLKGL